MENIADENLSLLTACQNYFGSYAMVTNIGDSIMFRVVEDQFPVIALEKAHGIQSCYIQKAYMANDYSQRPVQMRRFEPKFVICFSGPRPDFERYTDHTRVARLLETYFPMERVKACCPLVVTPETKAIKRKTAVDEIFTRKNMELLAYSIELALRQNRDDRYLLELDIKERMMLEINKIFFSSR